MKPEMKNVEQAFPEIIAIMVERYNRYDSWVNITENLSLKEVQEEKIQVAKEFVSSLPEDYRAAANDFVGKLTDLDGRESSSTVDIAFTDGFRTGARLLLEIIK